MGRIEKLDNERWKGWDWAASNKLNEVIEAVNTITEEVNRLKDLQEDDNYRLESNTEKEERDERD
jgi:hypothetical protein